MLSRHAEDLFWLGRYVERAEDTARMLDVTYHHVLESPPEEEPTAWQELLEVLFLKEAYEGPIDGPSVSRYLVTDPSNPGSIVSAIERSRENARGLRDRISTELWEAINGFHLELTTTNLHVGVEARTYELLSMVKRRCQLISGVAAQTMPRDEGYRFIILGFMLERAEMACRLLAVRYARLLARGGQMGFHTWVSVLKSVSAYEAYLKAHDAALDPSQVLEFLLLDPQFPRTVFYCLEQVEAQLQILTTEAYQTEVERAIGRVRAKAEFCDIDAIVSSGLDQFLEDLQRDIYAVAEAVDAHFFRTGTDLQLHTVQAI
jgi:uncharacterized alpha-E superfamily protein